ncbi:unnamed protein product [Bursaphelenchus xylophilus]|uniref:(pine wood nematode) hypothetical protein n=1 Tax=Bursaphelenchus xylophilus TaxID=6326 RepID=A0A1I7SE73_BURXY|nr:unnamed protein product [Bursaphelenchus xylophilus]CAG9088609.1 unnamed protein product [Bursaphelenchus xylophilus]
MANPLCELEDVNELREFVKTDEFKELEKSVENEIGAEKLQLLREMCMEAVLLCRHKDKDGELPPGMFEEFVDKMFDSGLNEVERECVCYYINHGLQHPGEILDVADLTKTEESHVSMGRSDEEPHPDGDETFQRFGHLEVIDEEGNKPEDVTANLLDDSDDEEGLDGSTNDSFGAEVDENGDHPTE